MLINCTGRTRVSLAGYSGELKTLPVRSTPTMDQIGRAVWVGYLDFRLSGEWRTGFTYRELWLTQFQQVVPAYQLPDPQALLVTFFLEDFVAF